ncbi:MULTISPECIES: MFS transporter [Frankia]|uniref:MFS transporter n=1 Tax=Frankia TaxID=1854 RepID=UPI0021193AEB|nr:MULTISPECIES: MFS transporter [Frankia]
MDGAFAALTNRNFRLYFMAKCVSHVGTWMQRVAQDYLVLHLGGGGTALGITVAVQFAPTALGGVHASVWVDRLAHRRRAMAAEQVAAAMLAVFLGVVALAGGAVWQVYLLAAGLGVSTVVSNPLQQSLLAEIVDGPLRSSAVALNSAAFTSGRVVGSALAGVVIAGLGVAAACWANAVSFAAVLVALAAMRREEMYPAPPVPRVPGQARAGLAYLTQRGDLHVLFTVTAIASVRLMPFQTVLVPLLVMDTFGAGATGLGIAGAALAASAVVGQLAAGRRPPDACGAGSTRTRQPPNRPRGRGPGPRGCRTRSILVVRLGPQRMHGPGSDGGRSGGCGRTTKQMLIFSASTFWWTRLSSPSPSLGCFR